MIKAIAFADVIRPIFNAVDVVLLLVCGSIAFHAFRTRREWPLLLLSIAFIISVPIALIISLLDFQSFWHLPLPFSAETRRFLYPFAGLLYPVQVLLYPTSIVLFLRRYMHAVPPRLPVERSA
jgi:hypothetical protein